MSYQPLKKKSDGFTIIEVLIVLAIAGLILLIVFLAVPSLQRNSRNTQIKNDAAVFLGYVNDFQANNNGSSPKGGCVASDGSVYLNKTTAGVLSPCSSASGTLMGKVRGSTTMDVTVPGTLDTQKLHVGFDQKCNATGTGFSANPRSVAIVYGLETAGDPTALCQES